jgi:acyl-CoA synthetase (AMP-forming)/AMP-acid ligase II
MMNQNHPTFFILLFAISKIGAIPSLINTNLANESLLHCIKISKAKLFLFDPVYEQQVATVRGQSMSHISFFAYGEATETTELDFATCPALTPSALKAYSTLDTEEKYLKGIGKNDAAFLIYTR